ncbi:hypothetical protein D3C72_1438500 [compost metagenome]
MQQYLFQCIPQFMIHIGKEAIGIFNNRDLTTQSIEYGCHLYPNYTAADNNDFIWLLLQRQRLC